MSPAALRDVLDVIFTRLDALVEARHLYKVETVGDAYVVVSGLFDRSALDELIPAGAPSTAGPLHTTTTHRFGAAPVALPQQLQSRVHGGGGVASTLHDMAVADAARIARTRSHLENVIGLGVLMQQELANIRREGAASLHMRIGIHTGDVVTGIVGSRRPRFGEYYYK